MPLVLDLLRHGLAAPGLPGRDHERPLTPRGEHDLARIGSYLARGGWHPDRAFASPLRRALDSADLVLRGLAPAVQVEELAELAPDHEPSQVMGALTVRGLTSGHILLVGHMPLLGRLCTYLTGLDQGFGPAMLVRIECAWALDQGHDPITLALRPEDCG